MMFVLHIRLSIVDSNFLQDTVYSLRAVQSLLQLLLPLLQFVAGFCHITILQALLRMYTFTLGRVAERRGSGLQNLLHGFESRPGLSNTNTSQTSPVSVSGKHAGLSSQ